MNRGTPSTIRRELVRIKLAEVRDSIVIVSRHLPGTVEEFVDMGLVKDGIYKKIEYAIENVLDICAVLNADLMLGVPGGDEDVLDHLEAHHVISAGIAQKVRGMKAFRNIMVHRYGAINDRIAYRLLVDHLGDFEAFQAEIEQFLREAETPKR
jgi:uncharacterized protein YutE (UPF0331/DUF86 family)